jgi:hypothetical protein
MQWRSNVFLKSCSLELQVAQKNAVADMQICIFVEMTPSTWGIMTALVKKIARLHI